MTMEAADWRVHIIPNGSTFGYECACGMSAGQYQTSEQAFNCWQKHRAICPLLSGWEARIPYMSGYEADA